MAIILRLQGLPWSATASDIRQYFVGLNIPDGGVHIVGGDDGDVFIAFASDEDARQAMKLQKEPLMGAHVMILLSSKSEVQEVIAKSRQAQGRDPFHIDTQSAPKESSATVDPSGQQQSYDRRDTSFASPMSPDPSQRGLPVVGDNFQDCRMTNAHLPIRESEMPYEDPYYQSSRAIPPESGSFGQANNNKLREFQDHDRRTPQKTWQSDAYPDLRRDSGSASFNDPQQPFYSDHNREADGLLCEVPGRQAANHPPRGQQPDQHWPRVNTRNRDSFEPGHGQDDPRDVSATGFNQQERPDSNQRYGRPPHPQDPFEEGTGRDFGRHEYAQEPGRNNHPPHDKNFEPSKEGPPAPSDANLPHDLTYKHELEESLCVYLKGLPFTIEEHEVVDFFRGLRIARDGIKFVLDPLGRPTGEGFVKFVSKRDTVDALKRHKSFIANRYVQVIPCTEIEYQTMLKPKVLQSADRHGHDGPPPRDRETLQRNNTHGIPALLELPTQEPFAPQDRDHRKDMPFSGRNNFSQRNRGPGGNNYGREGDSFPEGFNPSRENFNPSMKGVHPDSRGAINANSTDRFIPDNRENFTPDNRDRFNHGSRDNFPPDDSFSSARDDFPSGSREDHHHQGGRKGFPPGSKEGFPHGDRDCFLPGRMEGFPPGGREGFAPDGREGFPPGGREGFPPGGRDGFPPGGRDGFPQGDREGFPSESREGFHPGSREGFPPGSKEGFPPSSRDGFPPNSRDDFSTAKTENVPYVCSVDDIFQFYSDCEIAQRGVNFTLHVDGVNAEKSSGVMFMEFASEADASGAIAKSEQTIRRRKITVTPVSRKIFNKAFASQANVPDRRYMHRDANDRMANSGPSSVLGGPIPMVQRFGSGPLLRPGIGEPLGLARLNPFGKPRPGLLQSGPKHLFGSPHMTGEDTDGPDLNIQKLGSNNCVLGITNLPTDAGIKVILNFFQEFSPISNSVRLHFNNGGQPTGDALIAFPSPMLADNAVTELNGALLGGRRIGLQITQPPPGVM